MHRWQAKLNTSELLPDHMTMATRVPPLAMGNTNKVYKLSRCLFFRCQSLIFFLFMFPPVRLLPFTYSHSLYLFSPFFLSSCFLFLSLSSRQRSPTLRMWPQPFPDGSGMTVAQVIFKFIASHWPVTVI